MKCENVQRELSRYLGGELPPAEQRRVGAHLSSCGECRRELETLAVMGDRLGRSLQRMAAEVGPAPDARRRLLARLAEERAGAPVPWTKRLTADFNNLWMKGVSEMRKPLSIAVAALLVLVGAAWSVPAVRAEIQVTLADWFSFRDPNCSETECGELALDTEWNFAPLNPTEMPDGFRQRSSMVEGEPGDLGFGMYYTDGEHFVAIVQREAQGPVALPDGERVQVKGWPASLETGVAGELEWAPDPAHYSDTGRPAEGSDGRPEGPPEPLVYRDARRLTWVENGVRVEMVSDLSRRQVLRIARSMEPATPGDGDFPPAPPAQ